MSEEELIFSAIGSDNVNHFDLNVIANTLASTDRLVRQNKQQREENDKLKEKIVALRESALQIKTLYETESAKVARYDGQIESYASQLRELERQKMNAESDRLVAEDKLLKLQTNSERRIEQNTRRYHAICCDMVRLCLPQPYTTNQPPPELMSKARDLVEHFTNAEKQGLTIQDDVRESIQQLAFKNRKRKRLGRKDCHDKECQTVPTNGGMREKAINTDPYPIRPIVHHCATDVADLEPVPIVPEPKKTVCDKSTMHAMTTITRATCTSAFIKRIDFGMNFPEVTHKSVDEILRECVPLPPLLLSPIKEIVPLRNTIETQTETLGSSRQLVSCGTMTGLKNIRKRIDYRATSPTEPLEGLRTFIKKEEHADERAAHPHLATLCRLLGETIYTMMETGRRFDMQRYNMLYEQLTIIRSMLEEDGRRESMLMSAMFSNVRDPAVGRATETGYRKDSRTPFVATNPIAVNIGCVTSIDEGSSDSSGAEELCSVDATSAVLPEPAVPFATIPEAEVEATFIPTIITKETSVDDSVSLPQPEVRRVEEDAQSITTVNEEKAVAGTKQSETELVTLLSTTTTTASPVEEDAMDDDRIAQELRLMEEGDDGPAKQVDIATDCVTEEQESMPTPSSASTADQTPPRPSTPPSPRSPPSPQTSRSTTSTATFVSPIKVKETNELVKDQFKTPTELPIGMRKKLRIRRSSEALSGVSHPFKRPRLESSTSSGRLSPTSTEFLLEDDWDAKFSLMRAQLAPIGVTSLCGLTPLSPIRDQSSDESEKEEEQEDEALEALETDQMIENVSLEVDVPLESSREATSESDTGTNVTIESPPEAPVVREETHETMSPASPDPLQVDDAKMPIQEEVIETLEQTIVVSPKVIVEDSVVPQSPMSPPPPPPCSSDQKLQILHIETLSPASPDAEPLDVPHSPITLDVPLESPLSPPIPSTSSADTEPPLPLRIPLVHEASQLMGKHAGAKHGTTGPLFRAIEEYSNESRHEIIRRMAGELQPEAKSAKEAITAMIQRYIDSSEWTEDTVRETSKMVLERCQDATLIAQSVLDLIVSRGDIITNMNFTPPAPPLPGTQQKLVLLVRWIGRELRTLDRIILQDLNRRVFTFKSESVPLAGLLALTYMYVALEDSRPVERRRINTARLYIFKCLYYFGFKCIPLIHVVLRAFPLTLPRMGSANFDNSDTLVNTIRTVLMNMKYGDETKTKGVTAAFYRKRDLFNLLNTHYGYQRGSPTYEELLVNLMDKLRANRLRNVSYSLILVAKRNGFEWARKHIIQNRLHPLLSEYMRQFEQSCRAAGNAERAEATNSSSMAVGLDERIVACIFAVSSILKTQPSDEDVTGMMQIFTTIVQLAHRHPMIQEAAIAGLMRFSRFGQVAIYERISMWYPTHQISDRLKLMLTTMVHRKNSTFWNMLAKNRVV